MLKNLPPVFFCIRSALMRRGRSEHEADDLVQEAWIRLACYERRDEVREPEAFLMRTAMNLSIDVHRAQITQGTEVAVEDVVLIDPAPSVEQVVLNRERMARLQACLDRLSPRLRDMFMAARVDGLSYREIGEQYGLHPSTVEKHVAKVMMQLLIWMDGW